MCGLKAPLKVILIGVQNGLTVSGMIEEKTHRKSEPLQPAIPTLSPLCPLSLGPQLSVTGKKGISHVAKLGRPHALCLVLESEQSLVIDKLLLCLCLLAAMYSSMDLQFNVDLCSFNIRSVPFLIMEESSIAVYRWHFPFFPLEYLV